MIINYFLVIYLDILLEIYELYIYIYIYIYIYVYICIYIYIRYNLHYFQIIMFLTLTNTKQQYLNSQQFEVLIIIG